MSRSTGRRSRLERGQGTAEYLALVLAVAAALTVGLYLTGVLTAFVEYGAARAVERATCVVVEDPACDAEHTDDPSSNARPAQFAGPPYLDPSLTPLERATWGDYVALGDSYSSGEGGSEFEDGTDDADFGCDLGWDGVDCGNGPDKNTCHRSTNAYGQRISREIDFKGDYEFAACSGAVTDDLLDARDDADGEAHQEGEDAQLSHVDENTSLVTLSIGGNDANFGGVMQQCVIAGWNPVGQCSDNADEIRAGVDAVRDDVAKVLREARERAPNARIVVVGYPRLFPDPPSDGDGNLDIDTADQQFLNEEAAHLNDVIQQAVEDAGGSKDGIEFVDPYDAFEGCEIGTEDSCMNGLKVGTINGKPPVSAGSFHPNDKGHERLAALVEKQIREGQ